MAAEAEARYCLRFPKYEPHPRGCREPQANENRAGAGDEACSPREIQQATFYKGDH